jgi:hypothetical protein
MRRLPEEFESLSEVVERLELAGFSTDGAQRAVRDILRDRRYLKGLSWADTTTGVIVSFEHARVIAAPSLDEIDWETSCFRNQLLDSRGRRLAKIEVLIADVKWYLDQRELSADVAGSARGSLSTQKLAGESAAIKALGSHLKDHREMTRANAKQWLSEQRFAVTNDGFQNRVWPEARKLAGLPPIAPPGRKKKSSRNPKRLSKSPTARAR